MKDLLIKILIMLSLSIPAIGDTSECLDTSICGKTVSVNVTLTLILLDDVISNQILTTEEIPNEEGDYPIINYQ